MFEQRVLAITEDIMFKWRLLVEDGRKAGYTFSQPDLIIAATALHHGLTVVSRDVSDYQKARAPVLNPWAESQAVMRVVFTLPSCCYMLHPKSPFRSRALCTILADR